MKQYLAPNARGKTAGQLLNKAWRSLQRGELAKASSVCRAVLATQPDNADASYLLGVVQLQQGQLSKAKDSLGAVLRLQPTNVGAQLNYGNVLAQLNRADEALICFEKAISLKPDLFEAHLNHGSALLDLHRYEEALGSFAKALALNPNSVEALYNRGNALNGLQRTDEALASYNQIIELEATNALAFNGRGMTLYRLGRIDEALESLAKAVAQQPRNAEFHENYGNVLQAQGRLVEAEASYRRSLQLNRAYTRLGENLGIIEANGLRSLHLGTPVRQSAMRLDEPFLLVHPHDRALMSFVLFNPEAKDVLALGLGGGALTKFIHRNLPMVHLRTIEIDRDVIAVARSHFHVPPDDDRLHVLQGDAARYVADHPASASVLLVDIFDHLGMPRDLYSEKFFDDCCSALTAGGIALVHLWSLGPLFSLYRDRMKRSFSGRVLTMAVRHADSTIVLGFQEPPADLSWAALRERAVAFEAVYGLEFCDFVERLSSGTTGQMREKGNSLNPR